MVQSIFERLQQEIDAREKQAGLSPADLLALPDALRKLLNQITHRGEISLAEAAAAVGQDEAQTAPMLASLVDKGFLEEKGEGDERRYSVLFGRRRRRRVPLNIWEALSEKVGEQT